MPSLIIVLWPLKLNQVIGFVLEGVVTLIILIRYGVGLPKRLNSKKWNI